MGSLPKRPPFGSCQVVEERVSQARFSREVLKIVNHVPKLEGLDVVFVGAFNPAIFHPEWFRRYELLSDTDADAATSTVVGKELAQVEFGGIHLQCLPDRFMLATSDVSQNERIQDLINQIFKLLPHTPITACGINPRAHYEVATEPLWHKIGDTLAPKDLIWQEFFPKSGMQTVTIKAPRLGDFPGEINITVQPSNKLLPSFGIYIVTNNHFPLPESARRVDAAKQALAFMNSEWKAATTMSRRVAEKIFEKITV